MQIENVWLNDVFNNDSYWYISQIEAQCHGDTITIFNGEGPPWQGLRQKKWPAPFLATNVLYADDRFVVLFYVACSKRSIVTRWRYLRRDLYDEWTTIPWSALSADEKAIIARLWIIAREHMVIKSPNPNLMSYL